MFTLVEAVILGIVEGLTEFLPISSTGHLIVAARALGVEGGGTFEIVIQLGAVLAVAWFFRKDLMTRLRGPLRFWGILGIGFLPVAVVGLAVGDAIKKALFNTTTVGLALLVGGILLWWAESHPAESPRPESADIDRGAGLDGIGVGRALRIGLVQVLALIPGMSRSGATIIGGLLVGLDRKTATTFSFYLAIPTLGSATLYDLVRNLDSIIGRGQSSEYAVGIGVAFVAAYGSIGWLLGYVSRHDFKPFAIYRILAGSAVIALGVAGIL